MACGVPYANLKTIILLVHRDLTHNIIDWVPFCGLASMWVLGGWIVIHIKKFVLAQKGVIVDL